MKKYNILIEENIGQEFEVEAESQEEAIEIAEDKYYNSEFIIEQYDFPQIECKTYLGNDYDVIQDLAQKLEEAYNSYFALPDVIKEELSKEFGEKHHIENTLNGINTLASDLKEIVSEKVEEQAESIEQESEEQEDER